MSQSSNKKKMKSIDRNVEIISKFVENKENEKNWEKRILKLCNATILKLTECSPACLADGIIDSQLLKKKFETLDEMKNEIELCFFAKFRCNN